MRYAMKITLRGGNILIEYWKGRLEPVSAMNVRYELTESGTIIIYSGLMRVLEITDHTKVTDPAASSMSDLYNKLVNLK